MSETLIDIPGRLHSVATEGIVTGANEVMDDNIGEPQSQINANYNQKLDLILNDIDQSREIILSKFEEIEEFDNYYVTSYIIDQTNPLGLAETFIRKNIASKDATKKVMINGEEEYVDVIKRINDKSKLYVGRYNTTDETLDIKEISKEDKTLYADGTPVNITSSDEFDVFMKLPPFYWKCNMLDTDIAIVEFSMSPEHIAADIENWHYWDGDIFIGIYKGYIRNNKLYSKPGITGSVNFSCTDGKSYARNRGTNYTLITYEAHRMMALLGYGWLKTTDAQKVIGYGTETYPKINGLCDSLGFSDGMNQSINFWGIENWWGDLAEWVDNIQTANDAGLINILNKAGNVERTVQAHCALNVGGRCIAKMELGFNGDLIPKELNNDNHNRCFADYGRIESHANYPAFRSYHAALVGGGLGCLVFVEDASYVSGDISSRLQYKGSYNIVDNFD